MNKYKWKELRVDNIPPDILKEGKYEFHEGFPEFESYGNPGGVANDYTVIEILKYVKERYETQKPIHMFCYRRSEEKTLITRSGKTFVAYDKGINYLCIKPDYYMPSIILDNNDSMPDFYNSDHWKPFTAKNGKHVDENGKPILELTDEISGLRPKVVVELGQFTGSYITDILIYVDDKWFVLLECGKMSKDTHIQLATPHELQVLV